MCNYMLKLIVLLFCYCLTWKCFSGQCNDIDGFCIIDKNDGYFAVHINSDYFSVENIKNISFDNKNINEIIFTGNNSNDICKYMFHINGVKKISIGESIKDFNVENLSIYSDVDELVLPRIKDESIKYLSNFKNIKTLYVTCLNGNDELSVALSNLKYINKLVLYKTIIGINTIKAISSLNNINDIRLFNCFIEGDACDYISSIKNIDTIYIDNCIINGDIIKSISRIECLNRVFIVSTDLNKCCIEDVCRLNKLSALSLDNVNVDDKRFDLIIKKYAFSENMVFNPCFNNESLVIFSKQKCKYDFVNLYKCNVNDDSIITLLKSWSNDSGDRCVKGVCLSYTNATNKTLAFLADMGIYCNEFAGLNLSDSDMGLLLKVREKKYKLNISDNKIGDDGIRIIFNDNKSLLNITSINLNNTNLSNKGLLMLSKTNVNDLGLINTNVTDNGIDYYLSKIRHHMFSIEVGGSFVSGKSLYSICKNENSSCIEKLVIYGNKFSNEDVKYILSMKCLKYLTIDHTLINDEGIKMLYNNGDSGLETLRISHCNVTDNCVDYILSMNNLKEVIIENTKISNIGLKRIMLSNKCYIKNVY